MWIGTYLCEKRHHIKRLKNYVKRDLYILSVKRDVYMCEKRPLHTIILQSLYVMS